MISLITFIGVGNVHGSTHVVDLSYGEHFAISSEIKIGKTGSIEWSFLGTNFWEGITVLMYDESNYVKFIGDNPSAQGYELSDGSFYHASGTWIPPKKDIWHIVFINLDNDMFDTTVTIEVTFTPGEMAEWLLAIIIVAPILFVAGITVLVVFRVRKRKRELSEFAQR